MATRFYFPGTSVPPCTPAVANAPAWTSTTAFDRGRMSTTKVGTIGATRGRAQASGTSVLLLRQYVSAPLLTAFTINGTIKGQIQGSVNNAAISGLMTVAVKVKVFSFDGLTLRATPLAITSAPIAGSNPFTTNEANRSFKDAAGLTDIALTSYSAAAGDRIVIEIGYNDTDASANTSRSCILSFRDSTTDLAEAQADGTGDSWIEFSIDLPLRKEVTGDSGAIGVTETSAVTVFRASTDTGAVVGTEARALTVMRASTDTGAVAGAETSAVDTGVVPKVGTDAGTIGVAEAKTLSPAIASTDSGAVGSSESSSKLALLTRTDAGTVTGTDVSDGGEAFTRSDSGAIGGAETSALVASITADDTGLIDGGDDALTGAQTVVAEDSGTVGATEVAVPLTILTRADSGAIDCTETVGITVTVGGDDTGVITGDEDIPVGLLTRASADTLHVGVTESSDLNVTVIYDVTLTDVTATLPRLRAEADVRYQAEIFKLTGQIRAGGGAVFCFVGPPDRVVEWSLTDGGGALFPYTDYTDPWGRASCLYQAGGYSGSLTIQVQYGG